ncbi:MAG: BspA family leucine-rich repeat surface protein, partial [Clostridia bacterium]|nr:BspA family leucine-rich repeat surface protein [Clostridia bacterium]
NFDVQNSHNCGQGTNMSCGQNVENNGAQNAETSSHYTPPTSHCSRGITLIALIITIVIMLILAGITINLTLGENGIFQKAKLAKQNYELASAEEKLEMDLAICEMGGTVEATMEEYLLEDLNGLEMYNRHPYNPESDAVTAQTTEAAVVVGGKVYCVYLDNILDGTVTNKIKVVLEEGNNIMMGDTNASSEYGWLGTGIFRESISSITFLNNKPTDCNEFNSRDITAKGHNNQNPVFCKWTVNAENNELYDIEIGANGGVIAPINCKSLFRSINTKYIDMDNNFYTKNVVNMDSMFRGNGSLSITFGKNFDTSSVENMYMMFGYAINLKKLDLSLAMFNTENVKNMGNLFTHTHVLEELKLGNDFDTSNTESMDAMFYAIYELTDLELGQKFTIKNINSVNAIFFNSDKLQRLDLGILGIERRNNLVITNWFSVGVNCNIYVANQDVANWLHPYKVNNTIIVK